MSGDTDTALAKIHDAEILDAPVAWQHMLLGQVALFERKQKEALTRFEAAVKLDPENVIAQSMLAQGYVANGRWDDYANMACVIVKLQKDIETPTPEELLFMSSVFRFVDSEKALKMVDAAIDARSSFPLAQIERADMWSHHAMDRGNVDYAIKALKEIDAIATLHQDLHDNPLLRNNRLNSRLALASLYRSQGNFDKATEQLSEAKPDVEFMQNFPGFLLGNLSRIHYYGMKWDLDPLESNLDAMGQVMQVAAQNGNSGWIVDNYWTVFFRRGGVRIQQALRQLEQMPDQNDGYVVWARLVLLMEIGKQKEGDRIFEERTGSKNNFNFSLIARFFMPGEFEDKVKHANLLTQSVEKTKHTQHLWDTLQYFSGRITEDELISRTGESERDKSISYFIIGIRQLAEGRRTEAKKSFQLSANSPVYQWSTRLWAQAFADRMEKDPDWPEWLPAEPDGETK